MSALLRLQLLAVYAPAVVHGYSEPSAADSLRLGLDRVVASHQLARTRVDSQLNDTVLHSGRLPCAHNGVQGFVDKTATGSESPTLYISVADARHFTNERLPIYTHCQVWPGWHVPLTAGCMLIVSVIHSLPHSPETCARHPHNCRMPGVVRLLHWFSNRFTRRIIATDISA